MLEYYELLMSRFNFAAPHTEYRWARVYRRSSLGMWIGRKMQLYVVAAQPLLLSSEYDDRVITTRSTIKPFVWLTSERRLVVADGPRLVFTELEELLQEPASDEARWLDMGLRQDVGAMIGECARLHQVIAT